jgi:hypothetical protein
MVSGVEKPRRPDTVGAGGGLMQREPAGTVTEVAQLASSLDALEKNLARWAMGRSNPGVHCSSGPRPLIPFPFIQLFSIISKWLQLKNTQPSLPDVKKSQSLAKW